MRRGVDYNFWSGKRVFLTGHTGFKGSWLSLYLESMGSLVKGYALSPLTKPSLFKIADVSRGIESEIGDIRNLEKLANSVKSFEPDVVIHMAAQPLVRESYKTPVDTYATNIMGTVHVLEAARYCDNIGSIVIITTDKCYENKEWAWGYRENEPMGGHDPYSSSKACAEFVTSAYQRSFYHTSSTANVASARAGNVIGGGDWSHDRLLPDILRAFGSNESVVIRSPKATRPWQHVLEPLSGYLILAESLYTEGSKFAEGWNFGPSDEDCRSVEWILDRMVCKWGKGASWKLDTNNLNPHEANFLKLDCSKARQALKWQPKYNLDETLGLIVDWHLAYQNGEDMRDVCLKEISRYKDK